MVAVHVLCGHKLIPQLTAMTSLTHICGTVDSRLSAHAAGDTLLEQDSNFLTKNIMDCGFHACCGVPDAAQALIAGGSHEGAILVEVHARDGI